MALGFHIVSVYVILSKHRIEVTLYWRGITYFLSLSRYIVKNIKKDKKGLKKDKKGLKKDKRFVCPLLSFSFFCCLYHGKSLKRQTKKDVIHPYTE